MYGYDQQIWPTVVEDNDYRREKDDALAEFEQRQRAAEEAKRYRELYYQAMAERKMAKLTIGKD